MKMRTATRLILAAVMLLASLKPLRAVESQDAAIKNAQEDAFRTGGYVAAAAITGAYTRTINNGEMYGPTSLESLVKESRIIAIGTVLTSRGVLVPRGDAIRTHYEFRLDSILKWDLNTPRRLTLTVSVNGGRTALPGGRWVEETTAGFVPPDSGQQFLLCANPIPPAAMNRPAPLDTPDAEAWPFFGPQGLYRLTDRNSVLPADTRRLNVAAPSIKYRNANAGEFVASVREAILKTTPAARSQRGGS